MIKDIRQFLWFYDFQEMARLNGWLKTTIMNKKPTNMLFGFWFFIIECMLFIFYAAFMRLYIVYVYFDGY